MGGGLSRRGLLAALLALGPGLPATAATAEAAASAPALVLSIDGAPVYWPEFRFWLGYVAKHYKARRGAARIDDRRVQQQGLPLKQFLLQSAVGLARKDRAIEARARQLGIAPSERDLQAIATRRDETIRAYGGLSEYLAIVRRMYGSEEVFEYLSRIDALGQALFEHDWGEKGERCSDADVAAYVAAEGLMFAKYLFIGRGDSRDPAHRAKPRALIGELRARLAAGGDAETLLDALIAEYGEDERMTQSPNGRLLAAAGIEPEFGSAYAGLAEHRISGVVSTGRGHYVLLRLPITPELKVEGSSLRYWAAYNHLFKREVEAWAGRMTVEYAQAFYGIDPERFVR